MEVYKKHDSNNMDDDVEFWNKRQEVSNAMIKEFRKIFFLCTASTFSQLDDYHHFNNYYHTDVGFALVDLILTETDDTISLFQAVKKPIIQYADIGGMKLQKQEIRNAVELPLTHNELRKGHGIDLTPGVLMYGPPGCGKTMLAKAVAHHTNATFIHIVGSEFVQKCLGDGPRMICDAFCLAKKYSPSLIFIDEIDAIATKQSGAQTDADREVHSVLLELLNQMDSLDRTIDIKVLMASNQLDTLDPALLRSDRVDEKIEIALPSQEERRLIFSTITAKMKLSNKVVFEKHISGSEKISGAEIYAICQEAGKKEL